MEIQSDYNFVWYIVLRLSSMAGKNEDHQITHKTGAYDNLDDAVNNIYEQVKDLINGK